MVLRRMVASVLLLAASCTTTPVAEDAKWAPRTDQGQIVWLLYENKPAQAARKARAVLAQLPRPQTYDEVTQLGEIHLHLCEAETRLGEYDAAEASCLEAIETFETRHGSFSRKAPLDAYAQWFEVYQRGPDDPRRLEAEIAARERYLERLPDQRMLTASRVESLVRLGDLNWRLGNRQAAEDAYRQGTERAYDVTRDARGVAPEAFGRFAELKASLGRLSEAEAILKSGMDRMVNKYGADDLHTAGFYVALAELYVRQLRREDALPLATHALRIYDRFSGFHSYKSADALLLLAVLQKVTPEGTAEGERQLERALRTRADKFGTNSLPYAAALAKAALFHQVRQNYGEWERFARQGAKIVEAHFGRDHPETAQRFVLLATALHLQGESAKALPYAETAYDTFRVQKPLSGASYRFAMELLVKLYGALGNDAKRRAIQEELDAYGPSQAALEAPPGLPVKAT